MIIKGLIHQLGPVSYLLKSQSQKITWSRGCLHGIGSLGYYQIASWLEINNKQGFYGGVAKDTLYKCVNIVIKRRDMEVTVS